MAWLLFLRSAAASRGLGTRQTSESFVSQGNPILADGSVYSADPAPVVVNDTIYILAGRDEAGPDENDFVMNEWQIFETSTAGPAGGHWVLHRDVAEPQTLFAWASAGTAYAGQIVAGTDGRYYLYAPVRQANSTSSDPFAIGVAVSDGVLGPFADAHPSGPIISESVPAPGNNIQNIDPTVLVDTDGSVYIYWGTFNQLRGAQLESDMVTVKSDTVVSVTTLTGFFEAPWLLKRNGTYYLLYAGNNAGTDSPCTPTLYHACIAWGTAASPLGPWTYGGVALDVVSSTTSHPGVFEHPAGSGDHYLVYHTRDAVNGTHFRRSVAFDSLAFDDTTTPPSILTVAQTHRPSGPHVPTRDIAAAADPSSANGTPIQYWIAAVNDGRVEENPLPPDYWASWTTPTSPSNNTLMYTWNTTVQLNGTAMAFFADQDAGANVGVPPPAEWWVEYLLPGGDEWARVVNMTGYPTEVTNTPAEVGFETVSTTAIRAVLQPSGGDGLYGAVGVKEWWAFQPFAT